MRLRPLNRILAKHETVYVSEVIKNDQLDIDVDDAISEEEAEPALTFTPNK